MTLAFALTLLVVAEAVTVLVVATVFGVLARQATAAQNKQLWKKLALGRVIAGLGDSMHSQVETKEACNVDQQR